MSTWCQGTRYWKSIVENAPRVDLNGQPVGVLTASQALHAKRQASRQRGQDRRNRAKPQASVPASAIDSAVEQTTD
ncbi:hypothetical protein CUU62_26210 [Pseudomonas sp. WP001]|nr:hypothetical protein CUU62_26210 [Pseudomonas sp. WP001]